MADLRVGAEERRVADHDKRLQRIDEALYGNGHPENGLVWKVTENTTRLIYVEKFVKNIERIIWPIATLSVAACVKVLNVPEAIGFIARVISKT